MKTLVAGLSTLLMGIAVAHGAEPVVPPSQSTDPVYQQPQDGRATTEQNYERQVQPDGTVREQKKAEQKSKVKPKADEKSTY